MPRLHNPEQYKRATQDTIFRTAREVNEQEVQRTSIFNSRAVEEIPVFRKEELSLGRVVGRGGFCLVREIHCIKLKGSRKSKKGSKKKRQATNETTSQQDSSSTSKSHKTTGSLFPRAGSKEEEGLPAETSREYLARRVWSKGGKYVVKQLNPDLLELDRVNYLKGLIDLSLELSYLASLDHVNIMKVRGISSVSPFEEVGFFLVLDQLKTTLAKRLNEWMQIKRTTQGITGVFFGGKRKVQKLLIDRLLVAHDVAEAMHYLHSRNIIFRDLKPDNIGFDAEETLKIFDFGLAKELIESERVDKGLYRMTGFTGAIRYMAPEVGLHKPYNLKADVFSWSMLMWYIMSLEPPMGFYTPNMFVDRVFKRGYRPAVKDKWPDKLGVLMKACWSEKIEDRPNFSEIMMTLRAEAQVQDPNISDFLLGDGASGRSSVSKNH